jgi:hypothetical protein
MRRLFVALALVALPFTALRAAETVKLRALELKVVTIQVADSTGKPQPVDIKYAELVRQVLLTAPAQSESTDDVVKTVEVWSPIKKAIDAKEKRLLLSDADYQFILGKVNGFRWSPIPDAAVAVADFIAYVRGLKEEDFPVEAPKK